MRQLTILWPRKRPRNKKVKFCSLWGYTLEIFNYYILKIFNYENNSALGFLGGCFIPLSPLLAEKDWHENINATCPILAHKKV